MKTYARFAPVTLAAVIVLAGIGAAEAGWKRQGTVTGPYGGTVTSSGSGSCVNGVCSSNQTVTGPNGGVAVRKRTTTCYEGVCTSNGTITGPAGKVIRRSGTLIVN